MKKIKKPFTFPHFAIFFSLNQFERNFSTLSQILLFFLVLFACAQLTIKFDGKNVINFDSADFVTLFFIGNRYAFLLSTLCADGGQLTRFLSMPQHRTNDSLIGVNMLCLQVLSEIEQCIINLCG